MTRELQVTLAISLSTEPTVKDGTVSSAEQRRRKTSRNGEKLFAIIQKIVFTTFLYCRGCCRFGGGCSSCSTVMSIMVSSGFRICTISRGVSVIVCIVVVVLLFGCCVYLCFLQVLTSVKSQTNFPVNKFFPPYRKMWPLCVLCFLFGRLTNRTQQR